VRSRLDIHWTLEEVPVLLLNVKGGGHREKSQLKSKELKKAVYLRAILKRIRKWVGFGKRSREISSLLDVNH